MTPRDPNLVVGQLSKFTYLTLILFSFVSGALCLRYSIWTPFEPIADSTRWLLGMAIIGALILYTLCSWLSIAQLYGYRNISTRNFFTLVIFFIIICAPAMWLIGRGMLSLPQLILRDHTLKIAITFIVLSLYISISGIVSFTLRKKLLSFTDGPFSRLIEFENECAFVRTLLWTQWTTNSGISQKMAKLFIAREHRSNRKDVYDAPHLSANFQETYPCFGIEASEAHSTECWKNWSHSVKEKREIRVLDIGGGIGQFTAALLSDLFATSSASFLVDYFDRSEFQGAYKANLDIRCNISPLGMFNEDLIDAADKYDLIICSHSLYFLFNLALEQNNPTLVENFLVKLRRKLNPGGLLYFSSSNVPSIASHYRDEISTILWGRYITHFNLSSARMADEHRVVDTCFVLSRSSNGDLNVQTNIDWIQYFCKIPTDDLTDVVVRSLVERLAARVTDFEALPEKLLHSFRPHIEQRIGQKNPLVLLHKIEIALWGPVT